MNDNLKAIIVVVGLVCVTLLEVAAILSDIDGRLFATVIGAILTLVGLCFGIVLGAKKVPSDTETVHVANNVAVCTSGPGIYDVTHIDRTWFETTGQGRWTDP